MRSAAQWRRACGAASRRGNGGVDAGRPKSLQVVKKPFLIKEAVSAQRQHQRLQPAATRWSWTASAFVENGDVAGFPSPGVQQAHFAASAVPDPGVTAVGGDEGLLHVLRCEVEDLTKRSLNITPRKPPKSFTLVKDEPGELEMTLSRIYGLEDISMSCVLLLVSKEYRRKPEVGEDPDSRTKMLQLTISIARGGAPSALKMRCECYRDGFAIHQVDLQGGDEEESAYRPYFSIFGWDCEEELVNNFQMFLYERGLNADLAGYIEKHLERKRLIKSACVMEKISKFLGPDFRRDVVAEG